MIRRLMTSALIMAASFATPSFADSWADNWFDSATYSSGGRFDAQKRGFVTGGSFSGRLNLSDDYLMSVQLPKISAGCGGIDGFLGGLSFLDEDYLVQKFQRILQAAPAVAFDMALKTICKECSETLTKLEAAVNYLNGIQLNECALTKKAVAVMNPDDPTVMNDIWTEMTGQESLKQAMDRSWQEAKESMAANNNNPLTDLKTTVASCPTTIKNIFGSGSVVDNMAQEAGLGEFSEVMRGFIGDVRISATDTDMIPRAASIPPCPDNDLTDVKSVLYGYAQTRSATGVCAPESNNGGVVSVIESRLDSIANKMLSNTSLNATEEAFINNTSFVNVYSLLKIGIQNGTVEQTKLSMRDLVATGYSYYMMDSLFANTNKMFRDAESAVQSVTYDPDTCNIKLYTKQIEQFKGMHERLMIARDSFRSAFSNETLNYMNSLQLQMSHQELGNQVTRDKSRALQ